VIGSRLAGVEPGLFGKRRSETAEMSRDLVDDFSVRLLDVLSQYASGAER